MNTLVVVYDLEANGRRIVSDALGDAAEAVYLTDLDDAARADALRNARRFAGAHDTGTAPG